MKKVSTIPTAATPVYKPSIGRASGQASVFAPNQHPAQPHTPAIAHSPLNAKRGVRLLRAFSPLPPGDPVALVGTSPQLNVIATDYDGTNYFVTYSQNFG